MFPRLIIVLLSIMLINSCVLPLMITAGLLSRINYKPINTTLPSKPSGCAIDIYATDQSTHRSVTVVGEITIGELDIYSFGTALQGCTEGEILITAKDQACAVGADAIQITKSFRSGLLDKGGGCYVIYARFLKYEFSPAVASINPNTATTPSSALKAEVPNQLLKSIPSGREAITREARTALVIGNSAYINSPLRTPQNDSHAIGALLRNLNFDVTLVENGNRRDMIAAIEDFGRKLRSKGGVGLVFYAGHGMQIKGRNYLIPVDAKIGSEVTAVSETVDLDLLLVTMAESGTRINVVILDACRDNPFERRFRGAGGGLAPMNASDAKGTLIAYSTDPGKTASDGDSSHSPYTQALIEALPLPNLTIEQVFKHVRRKVQDLTAGAQTPWETSSLTGEFSFK